FWSLDGTATKPQSTVRTVSYVWWNDRGPLESTIRTFGIPSCVLPSASTRQPHDPIFHSPSRRPSWYWLDNPKLKCSTTSKPLSTRRHCPRWNLARCAICCQGKGT